MLEKMYEMNLAIYVIIIMCVAGFCFKLAMLHKYNSLIKEASGAIEICSGFVKGIEESFVKKYEQSYRVNNVSIFVDKHMYDIKMLRIRDYVWETVGILLVILCLVIGTVGAACAFYYGHSEYMLIKHVMCGFVSSGILVIVDVFVDLQRKREQLHTNIYNYLENYLKPRLELEKYGYNINSDVNKCADEAKIVDVALDELSEKGMEELIESIENLQKIQSKTISNADGETDGIEDGNILEDIITEYLT